MDRQKELACLCALNRIFGFDPKAAIALIRHFGSAHDVFMAGPKAASAVLGPFSRHQMNLDRDMVSAAQDELASLERKGIRFTGWTAPEEGVLALVANLTIGLVAMIRFDRKGEYRNKKKK